MAFGFIKKAFTKTAEAAKASVEKLKDGLTKTRDVFVGGLRSLLRGKKLDEALLKENFADLCAIVTSVEAHDSEQARAVAQSHVRRFNKYMEQKGAQ